MTINPSRPKHSHTRHRSDGYNIPLTYSSNYSKYIRNPKKKNKSKSKSKSRKRGNSRGDSEESNLISSVQVFNTNKNNYFSKKKLSSISEVNKTLGKRSPSITMMKKK